MQSDWPLFLAIQNTFHSVTLRTATYLLNFFQQHTICHELDLCFICNVAFIADLIRNHSVRKYQGSHKEKHGDKQKIHVQTREQPSA